MRDIIGSALVALGNKISGRSSSRAINVALKAGTPADFSEQIRRARRFGETGGRA